MRSMGRRWPPRKISGNQRAITGRRRPRVPTHDFHIFWSFLPEARNAIGQLGRFVRTVASTPGESAAPHPG
jgi:hypothetical protein